MSKYYKGKYDQEGVKRGEDWQKNRAIVKCKCGHVFSFAHWAILTEWGHRMGAYCEGCLQYVHAMELEFIEYDTERAWSATGKDASDADLEDMPDNLKKLFKDGVI